MFIKSHLPTVPILWRQQSHCTGDHFSTLKYTHELVQRKHLQWKRKDAVYVLWAAHKQLSYPNPGRTLTPQDFIFTPLLGPYSPNDRERMFERGWGGLGLVFLSLNQAGLLGKKHFNWFWSSSCWECLSPLKHAWHTEIKTAYYHIKEGNRPLAVLCKRKPPIFDDTEHKVILWTSL